MSKTITGRVLFVVSIIVTSIVWIPALWAGEILSGEASLFEKAWSNLAIKIYPIWLILLLSWILLFIWSVRRNAAKFFIFFVALIFCIFAVGVGPVIHVCALGVDCI
jgi:hypothetical protein